MTLADRLGYLERPYEAVAGEAPERIACGAGAVTRQNVAYLVGGIAFGFVFGFGVFHTVENRPGRHDADASAEQGAAGPSGPMAPTQMGGAGGAQAGAPMMERINALKRRLQADPRDLGAAVELANLYYDVGMHQQAIGFYEQAVAIQPNDANLLTDLGSSYQATRQYEKALDLFTRAQSADPTHWQSLYNQVVVLAFNLGRLDDADTALRRLEQSRPGLPQAAQLRRALDEARARGGRPS